MNDNPLVSVIIPSYNSGQFVVQAVKSALCQTQVSLEVIVVDDGSIDETGQRLSPEAGRIRYIYQSNGGLSKARNRGICEARGKLIAFLDADDQWLPDKLSKQCNCLEHHPESAMVHTDLYRVRSPTGTRIYSPSNRRRLSGRCYYELFWGNVIVPSTVLLTRECLNRVGLFDESIKGASTQDMDLWLRIARHYAIEYVDEPLVLYLEHDGNASRNQWMMLEDELYVLQKTLRDDPPLKNVLGRRRVASRMSKLAFAAGYANTEVGELERAKHYFGLSYRYDFFNLRAFMYLVSTLFPAAHRQKLRTYKRLLFG